MRKSLVEKLPANHSMQGKSTVPPKHFYSLEERNDPLVPESNVPQKEYYRVDHNVYHHHDNNDKISSAHQYASPSSRNYVFGVLDGSPRRNNHAHNYPNPSAKNYVFGVLDGSPRRNTSTRNISAASTSTSTSSQSPARLWVVKKN